MSETKARRKWWIHDGMNSVRDQKPHDQVEDYENFIPVTDLLPGDVILTREEAVKVLSGVDAYGNSKAYTEAIEILEAAMK